MVVDRLNAILKRVPSPAIAVSGGVDSMTLAYIACNVANCQGASVYHAVSPAVPPQATQRVKLFAQEYGWLYIIIDTGEFSDVRYRDNPVNRCYYCKSNLYTRIRQHTKSIILSGANLDDLSDYRPGLIAAHEAGVRHPFIEAEIGKQEIRQIAREHGLDSVYKLPAQPCLASRVETGIPIEAGDLALINDIEQLIEKSLGSGDIRCRITSKGIRLELPDEHLENFGKECSVDLVKQISQHCLEAGQSYLGYGSYRRGSAFIHKAL